MLIDVGNWTDLQNLGIGAIIYIILDRIFTFVKPFIKPKDTGNGTGNGNGGVGAKSPVLNESNIAYLSNTISGIIDSKLESRFGPLLPVLTALNATCQRMEILMSRATTMLEERRDRDRP